MFRGIVDFLIGHPELAALAAAFCALYILGQIEQHMSWTLVVTHRVITSVTTPIVVCTGVMYYVFVRWPVQVFNVADFVANYSIG